MDIIFVISAILFLANLLIHFIVGRFNNVSSNYLWLLFAVHFILTIAYLLYSGNNASDSVNYYIKSLKAEDWLSLFQTGTVFITFLGFFFIKLLNLSYNSVMLIFSFLGYIGCVYFYLAAKENISISKGLFGYSYTEILFLLPNLHFWSSSLGKGSIILLGLAFLAFGLSRFNRRIVFLLLGSFLVFMIRPHILFSFITAIVIALLITQKGIKWYFRFIIFIAAIILFFSLIGTVTEFTETDSLNVLSSNTLNNRASELSKASSGVDIQNYSLVMKLFSFWFRPLFVDGLSGVGLLASFENLLYLLMFWIIIKEGFFNWPNINGWFRIGIIFFLIGSLILSQISGNLGIAMRQKAQLTPFFFIFFCKVISFRESYNSRRVSIYQRR